MKKLILLFLVTGITCVTHGQTSLYENPDFVEIAKSHESIAILPFKTQVSLRPKQMKKLGEGELERLEQSEGEAIQKAMFSWFLKRKKRGDLQKINLQDPKKTTAMLKKQDIDYTNVYEYTSEEIAEMLGVDAVISGDFETNKPMSEGASVALGLLVGFWGATNSAVINMSVNNGSDGVLLWNYNKKVKGGLGSSPEDLINTLMRKASRRLAYTKGDF